MVFKSTEAPKFDAVSVIGLGYIGLPTAAFIASKDINVTGIDVNPVYVDSINAGKVPFYEPGFEQLLRQVVQNGMLTASDQHVSADAYIVCVPTPFTDDHKVDPKFIESAARSLAPHLNAGALVVLESTSPPGTTQMMANLLLSLRPDLALDDDAPNALFVAHCPERVLPGRIMEEMENNDRVIGGLTPKSTFYAKSLYQSFCSGEILETDATTAEMAKLTENSFRDVNIAFANELSIICDKLGIDVWELINLANHHPRVNILQPGPGVGGHCIAVDPWFIVSTAPEQSRLIKTAREVNDHKPQFVIDKIDSLVEKHSFNELVILGIAFKADIDDLRESPSLQIAINLAQKYPSLNIKIVEPNISKLPSSLLDFPNVSLETLASSLPTYELVLVLVDHTQFKESDRSLLAGATIVDTKGIF